MEREQAAIATSDPRATAVGAALLAEGASAMDAAAAAALVLFVVEPSQCGPGGDGFLIHVEPGSDPVALDGAGELPLGLTDDALAAAGLDTVPARGPLSCTVPGALGLLEEGLRAFGTRSLGELVAPAVRFAHDGFDVRPTLAAAAGRAAAEIAGDPVLGPLYAPAGRAVAEGDTVRNPVLGDLLAPRRRRGCRMRCTTARSARRSCAGSVTVEGCSTPTTSPSTAATGFGRRPATFRGSTVWELPAPTQGPAVLGALAAIEASTTAVEDWAPVVEMMRRAMADAGFDLDHIGARPSPARGDTTYIAAIDRQGRGASLITSVFGDFGAHFGIPELGGPIGNRATMLRALGRPMAPGTKPPHTTIPAAVTRDGALQYVLGVAGGFMQPQAQVQVLVHLLERGLDPQAAIDQPRFRIGFGGVLVARARSPARRCDARRRRPSAGTGGLRRGAGGGHRRHWRAHRRRRSTPSRRGDRFILRQRVRVLARTR